MVDLVSSKFGLDGRTAVVTGSGQGIGKAIALLFAQAGADVVVAELNRDTCETTAQEVRALGRRSLPVVVDVTRSDQLTKLIEATVQEFGHIDIWVNNVGVGIPLMPAIRISEDDWEKVIRRNLTSVFLCSKAVVPVMIEQKKGNIVNICSGAGARPRPGHAAYAAAKAGAISYTRTLAAELARYNIRVNCILPGRIDTKAGRERMDTPVDRLQLTPEERAKQVGVPLGRIGRTEDIALASIYLASDASDYLTGESLEVKGGPITRAGDLELFIARFPQL